MLLTSILTYIAKQIKRAEKPQTYGSALEKYIVSKNPQNTYDVEALAREFEAKQKNMGRSL
jgi:hypothetical protein